MARISPVWVPDRESAQGRKVRIDVFSQGFKNLCCCQVSECFHEKIEVHAEEDSRNGPFRLPLAFNVMAVSCPEHLLRKEPGQLILKPFEALGETPWPWDDPTWVDSS